MLVLVACAQVAQAFAPGSTLPLMKTRASVPALRHSMTLQAGPSAGLIAKAAIAAPVAAAQASILVNILQHAPEDAKVAA